LAPLLVVCPLPFSSAQSARRSSAKVCETFPPHPMVRGRNLTQPRDGDEVPGPKPLEAG
jgi:hypothetical protein